MSAAQEDVSTTAVKRQRTASASFDWCPPPPPRVARERTNVLEPPQNRCFSSV
ncbi:hypothetical protein OH76DRAFT_460035 [Lentinus brumalis]|uniref:Uncharacterized protein n=1 Tax=Lentinus brumalis TaxID=2498619 RepID=A0A371CII2_9APHY|nr:hypothetical protein OH76DRAFT_460035 [Polyporus brumalis]